MSDIHSVSSGAEGVCDGSVGGRLSTSSGSESVTEDPATHSDNAPFQASVEDCPEEDGVFIGTPRPALSSPVKLTPAAPEEAKVETAPVQQQPPSTQEYRMPAFIQLSGPSMDQPPQERPEPLHYLDPGSPILTQEAIRRSISDDIHVAQPVATSPSALSHSSVPSSHQSDVFSQGGHRNSNSHDSSSWGSDFDDSMSHVSHRQFNPPNQYPQQGAPSAPNGYPQPPGWPGSPHMQYGHPHASPFPAYAMAEPYQGSPNPPPQHNRWQPQRPPMTGYQSVAATLTGSIWSYPKATPIYRRFEALNHRLLLQLQDEIVELEQQLDQLDDKDTTNRTGHHGPVPASRRAEVAAQSNICLEKQRLFTEIGSRLHNYYKLLESFRNTQFFSCPSQQETQDYRTFFAREQLICEAETRFLDRESDLISLAAIEYEESHHDAKAAPSRKGDATPTPQSTSVYGSPQVKKAAVDPKSLTRRPMPRQRPPTDFAYAVLGAVAAPLLSFTVISGFLERMVIVGIVFAFVCALVVQSSLLNAGVDRPGMMECTVCAVIYSGFMGVVAWSFA